MAENKEVVPGSDEGFDKRFLLITQVVGKKTAGGSAAEWTHIPAEKVEELNGAYASWHAAFLKMAGPHTSVETAEKNSARDTSEPVLWFAHIASRPETPVEAQTVYLIDQAREGEGSLPLRPGQGPGLPSLRGRCPRNAPAGGPQAPRTPHETLPAGPARLLAFSFNL